MENEYYIIEARQQGETQQFALLYDAYVKKIYNYIFYRTFQKEIAEDLTSSVFMKALEKIKSYSPAKGAFSSWLYQIAKNTLVDYFRSNRTNEDISAANNFAGPDNVEKNIHARLELEKIKKYLNRLPKEQSDIILMRVWDELSFKEISEILGKSEAASKMQFFRTLEKMHKEIALALIYLLLIKP